MKLKLSIINYKLLVVFILFGILSSVSLVLALEQTYPDVGSVQLSQLTKKTVSPQHLLKFLTTWAIALSVLAIVGSLIYAGVMYLVSTGKPQATTDAKQRVQNSLIGLAIVLSAYLVLALVNPQLTIFYLERQSIQAGIILFTEAGYNEFDSKGAGAILDIIDEGEAYPLPHDVADLNNVLGPLVVQDWDSADPKTLNFAKLPLFAIGFWPNIDPQTKVLLYPKPDFETTDVIKPVVYTRGGRVNQSGVTMGSHDKDGMSLVKIDKTKGDGFFETPVPFLKINLAEYQGMPEQAQQDWQDKNSSVPPASVLHPPLSIAIQNAEPGVYLYSQANEELFLTASQPYLDRVSFDKKAVQIKIKNFSDASSANFFTVLREDFAYGGSAKVFFPKAQLGPSDQVVPLYCPDGTPMSSATKECEEGLGSPGLSCAELFGDKATWDKDSGAISLGDFEEVMGNLNYGFTSEVGNIAENETQAIVPNRQATGVNAFDKNTDRYGAVNSVSSVELFRFADDFSACQEVQICNKEGGQDAAGSECISYLSANNPKLLKPEVGVAKYPLPLFEPVNIPEWACVVSSIDPASGLITLKETQFKNEIRSIKTEPQSACLVGLFENSLVFDANGNFSNWLKKPDTGFYTTFFTETMLNLLGQAPIGKCGSEKRLGKKHKSCVSSIVAYPIFSAAGGELKTGGMAYLTGSGAAKAAAALNRFTPDIVLAIKNSGVCNNPEKFGSIILDGQTQKIDPATFVQMIIVQESMGNKDACHVDAKIGQVTCGLMQADVHAGWTSCTPNPCVGLSPVASIGQGIAKLKLECPDTVKYSRPDGSLAQVSCAVAASQSKEFWPYLIINYNTVANKGNEKSNNCPNLCDFYANYPNGGCFLPPNLQTKAYPTKVECPIKRGTTDKTGYNVTYRYILNVRDGYSYLKSLGNDPRVASCSP